MDTTLLDQLGRDSELPDATFASEDGQQSPAHKVVLTLRRSSSRLCILLTSGWGWGMFCWIFSPTSLLICDCNRWLVNWWSRWWWCGNTKVNAQKWKFVCLWCHFLHKNIKKCPSQNVRSKMPFPKCPSQNAPHKMPFKNAIYNALEKYQSSHRWFTTRCPSMPFRTPIWYCKA